MIGAEGRSSDRGLATWFAIIQFLFTSWASSVLGAEGSSSSGELCAYIVFVILLCTLHVALFYIHSVSPKKQGPSSVGTLNQI